MIRRKLKHSRVKNLYKFASQKNKGTCLVESSLEFDACFHFEYSREIKTFEAQPLGFEYEFDGRVCRYTPDFLISHHDKPQKFIEIKPYSKIANPDFRARFAQKQLAAKAQTGIELILVTDKQIRVYPTLDNLKLLHRYSGFQSLTDLQLSIIQLVNQWRKITIQDLVMTLKASIGEVLASVCRLLSLGSVHSDLNTELTLESVIWADGV
ncbi:TnsA endonuclease N-terminal domain-containing protein [Pseudoalteromonas xiamenensis]|uniref:Tn7 transposase TnsA N-terminal domain-containing protein n=1 Tax=Pseudoalteromonas xiamenensis TaxID=882626 RepID=A0A975HKN0_9GAMM|nr:TnsA endonuclease N-terminal domain-containing protein [Pseudoalteromonas xiamenensis]QTH71198.1 Tn7 transposase TnsA N-terminal domain-containing protein [Pseudoalteromonas xiamenensis]